MEGVGDSLFDNQNTALPRNPLSHHGSAYMHIIVLDSEFHGRKVIKNMSKKIRARFMEKFSQDTSNTVVEHISSSKEYVKK